ncbi:MAG TPA: glyceraldehyde 3-phosphate dehydrogenase NAD-binding domain-containing protein, partial [Bacillota bacterium]|nr:glyceraldehyde 3-phosphate dehydrogenase NAD-binding domain-containing protein [Bacillota bacterium]
MSVKVAINGFGRIGRLVFRAGWGDSAIEFVGINDLATPEQLAYLLKYDSVQTPFPGTVGFDREGIIVDGKKIPIF